MSVNTAVLTSVACLVLCLQSGPDRSPRQPASVETKIDQLIQKLTLEKGHPGAFEFDVCQVFSPVDTDHGNSPSHKLAHFGYKAVPKLIAALTDRRLTKCPGSLRVGDVSLQILEQIAARRFTSFYARMQEQEIPQRSKEISSWWASAQKLGELAALTSELSSPGNQQAAEALVKRYPTRATAIIRAAFHSKKPGLMRDSCNYALAISTDPAALAALKEEAESGPDPRSRVAAAAELHGIDSEFETRTLIKEWRNFSDSPGSLNPLPDPMNAFGREGFIDPMLQTEDLTALDCLAENLETRSNHFRDRFVWAIASHCEALNDDYATTLESLLARKLLFDFGQASSGGLGVGDRSFSFQDPEIGDLAAVELSLINPTKYRYKPLTFRGQRLTQRAQFQNAWLTSMALSPDPLPPAAKPKRKLGAADQIVSVVLRHDSQATNRLAMLALGLNHNRLNWTRLIELYRGAAAISSPPNRCVRVLVSRELPGDGLTLTIDFNSGDTPRRSGGTLFGWSGSLDGQFAFGEGGGLARIIHGTFEYRRCLAVNGVSGSVGTRWTAFGSSFGLGSAVMNRSLLESVLFEPRRRSVRAAHRAEAV